MLFLALFSFLESQLCTSRGIQCYSSGLPLRFPFLWCISTAVQVACYVVYWISKALWSQTGDLIPLLSDRRNHLHVWATFLSVLAARLLPVLFLKKNHTQTCLCWITVYKWMQKSKQWMHLKQQTVYICCKQMTVVRHCLFLYFGWNGMKHFKCGRTQIFHHTHAHTGGGEMTPLTLVSQPATLNNPVRMYSLAIRRF